MTSDESFTILIVDDNKNNLLILKTLINKFITDVKVVEADSGQVALNMLLCHLIDLIILDVQMFDMDGFETARRIRKQEKTRWLPMVFLTAVSKSSDCKQKGFELGAIDYLTKPIDTEILVDKIKIYKRFVQYMQAYQAFAQKEIEQREMKFQREYEKLRIYAENRATELLKTNQYLDDEIKKYKRIEVELQKAKNIAEKSREIAESANLIKSQFIANINHILKTPLNIIIEYSSILEKDARLSIYDDALLKAKNVCESSKQLLTLINDLLDVSKIESDNVELSFETFDLMNILNDIISAVQPLIEKNSNTLIVDCAQAEGEMHTDLTKLYQMLLNLLSNAAKFTYNGIVNFKISRESLAGEEWVNFCVSDTGNGLTKKQKQQLLQTLTNSDSQEQEIDFALHRTGMNLLLTRELVAMMGGYITVSNQLKKGSSFIVHLPARINVNMNRKSTVTTY